MNYSSIFDFSIKTIDGQDLDLSTMSGSPLLIVNTASLCGKTPQYEALQELYEAANGAINVLAFPANDFGQQEPGTNEEIKAFCTENYQVTFPMSEKVTVVGDNMHEVFAWLTEQENPDFTGEIQWNFEKFVLNAEGKLIARFRSDVHPADPMVLQELGLDGLIS